MYTNACVLITLVQFYDLTEPFLAVKVTVLYVPLGRALEVQQFQSKFL